MHLKKILYKVTALIMVLALLVPVLAACGDDDDETPTLTKTAEPTKTTEPTPTKPVSTEPVKIGVTASYTGSQAMFGPAVVDPLLKVVRRQIEDRGGILGGRPVKFIVEDDNSETAGAAAAATKLIIRDNVSAILFGGSNEAQHSATQVVCEEYGIPYFTHSGPLEEYRNPYRFNCGMTPYPRIMDTVMDFVVNELEAKTVAFLFASTDEHRTYQAYMKEGLESAGLKTVSSQFVEMTTTDMAPYVTKLKYENPDVLIVSSTVAGHYFNLYKQFAALGGFGDTKIVATDQVQLAVEAHKRPEAVGAYFWTPWIPEIDTPGGKEYRRAWYAVHSKEGLMLVDAAIYTGIHMALASIEMAGSSDPEKIWEAAKSGKVVWEGLTGPTTLLTDGTIDSMGMIVEIVGDGKLTQVWPAP